MTPICPDIPDGGRYTPGQTARLLGVHYNSVYLYTKSGRLTPTPGRRTTYTGANIKRFWKRFYTQF